MAIDMYSLGQAAQKVPQWSWVGQIWGGAPLVIPAWAKEVNVSMGQHGDDEINAMWIWAYGVGANCGGRMKVWGGNGEVRWNGYQLTSTGAQHAYVWCR